MFGTINHFRTIQPNMPDTIDHNQRFQKILYNSEKLLKEDPVLLQQHLDVGQIMWLVKHEKTQVLEVLLQEHASNTVPGPKELRDLLENMVLSFVFHNQNTQLLEHLRPWIQHTDLTRYTARIHGAVQLDFIQAIEPNIVLPCGVFEAAEVLSAVRSKRLLEDNLGAPSCAPSIKKM